MCEVDFVLDKLEWWGYEHKNGSIHAKRYFSRLDIDEADISPFVTKVFGPFEAGSIEEAHLICRTMAKA